MRHHAGGAVLHTVFQPLTIAAALAAQRIQGAIAKETVEILRMGRFMTGEKLTLLVLHKGVATLTGFLIKHVVAHSTVTSPSSQAVTCMPVLTYSRNSSPRLSTTGILPSVHTSPEMASLTANGFL